MRITVTVRGLDILHGIVRDGQENGSARIAAAARARAEAIMTDSKTNYVPVDTGNLRNSGVVLPVQMSPGRIEVTLGYGGPAAPYALKVHENPRSGKTGGVSPRGAKYQSWARVGQWKYLEIPFLLGLGKVDQLFVDALRVRRTAQAGFAKLAGVEARIRSRRP